MNKKARVVLAFFFFHNILFFNAKKSYQHCIPNIFFVSLNLATMANNRNANHSVSLCVLGSFEVVLSLGHAGTLLSMLFNKSHKKA